MDDSPRAIEDYALIGDRQTAALVGRDGSIDWLCLPRFDSAACFAALLGSAEHGRWRIAPVGEPHDARTRAYRDGSLVLDTTFDDRRRHGRRYRLHAAAGRGSARLVRVVRGVRGRVRLRTELVVRFDYGSIVPWVRRLADHGLRAIAGPDALHVQGDVPLQRRGPDARRRVRRRRGQTVAFVAHLAPVAPAAAGRRSMRPQSSPRRSDAGGRGPASAPTTGERRDVVLRSLVTLKALDAHDAPAASSPRRRRRCPSASAASATGTTATAGCATRRSRSWRSCTTATCDEARAWREWLLRAVAGDPSKLQILYGVDGERRLGEEEIPWLPGYDGSRPVRVGNAAYEQRQLDVYGEVMDVDCTSASAHGLQPDDDAWALQRSMLEFLESHWDEPDEGIWEMRGPAAAFHALQGDGVGGVRPRRAARSRSSARRGRSSAGAPSASAIHEEVCRCGFDAELGSFVQYYGSKRLDASLLMIPLVGFLPPTDPRVQGTARAIDQRTDGTAASCVATRAIPAWTGCRAGEGDVPPVQLLARRQLGAHGPHRRRAPPLRPPRWPLQRRRSSRGRVRRARRPPRRATSPRRSRTCPS